MISLERELAEALDAWALAGRALITEHTCDIVVGKLSAADAGELVRKLEVLGWDHSIEDGSPAVVTRDQLEAEYEPFRIKAKKPTVVEGRDHILTNAGLKDWLGRSPAHPVVEVSLLAVGFETLSVKFTTRNGPGDDFEPEMLSSDPRAVVKESGQVRVVPGDVSPWILRSNSQVDLSDTTTRVWADAAALNLSISLANEIEGSKTVLLKGTPVTRYDVLDEMAASMGADGFEALQACARWTFSVPKETETRHILLTAELSRVAPGSNSLPALYVNSGKAVLEGAKIAYEMGLHKISADTLKALADLRKAVSDEAAKLGDTTRQLAGAVSGAMFGGIALIVARLTMAPSNLTVAAAVLLIGFVLAIYVGGTIWTGNQFVNIQRDLRDQWRNRLYRFLPEDEYQRMVLGPAQRAESAFSTASWISGILAIGLLAAVTVISGPEIWRGIKDWRASHAVATTPTAETPLPSPETLLAPTVDKATAPDAEKPPSAQQPAATQPSPNIPEPNQTPPPQGR
ncbi:hypothetical protein [Rhizobium sp. BK060]|uniref:hypothetical protein n=1 Tax=Rhizobium sp. BK060 TaxID=2587096 RepID=UPI001608B1BB|nr:hypothetical protein [Rhizobium sp. BK060]MBB3394215.1 hypothetical protein [Rhizobium sp. BK060]